ncbi:MAG: von Willebrand factor type A domain-containing protein [Ignavibacteriaceae bacterium]
MRYSAILLAFFFISQLINAQTGSISGTVTDAQNGQALIGANLFIDKIGLNTATDLKGYFKIMNLQPGIYKLRTTHIGYKDFVIDSIVVEANKNTVADFQLSPRKIYVEDLTVIGAPQFESLIQSPKSNAGIMGRYNPNFNTEEYAYIEESGFRDVGKSPLSTFSIDVDAASYSNTRRFLMDGILPPKDAVRIEEFINYFDYDYAAPKANDPFAVTLEYSQCPWNNDNMLVHIGLKGKELLKEERSANNLIFLLDVSGSMNQPDKLPLLKRAFKMLVEQLDKKDKISIVVYAGAAGLVLPPTSGSQKDKILSAIENLEAGGSTAGGAGIMLAYKTAKENFIKNGNNRVILATDGDFNIGISNTSELVRYLDEQKNHGIFLTILGFGQGNIKDSRMEELADKGNGHYAYIDNILEAKKVLVDEIGATLYTIAKDVKIQVEFNPAKVKSYRLIGYENRMLNAEDFEDDKKDAGEIGAGHTVTALYEIVLSDGETNNPGLKYQESNVTPEAEKSNEVLTVSIRYKDPDKDTSKLISKVLINKPSGIQDLSDNFKFSAAVAEFGMLLRDSEYKANASFPSAKSLAESSKGTDRNGYRSEFLRLVSLAENLMDVSHKAD